MPISAKIPPQTKPKLVQVEISGSTRRYTYSAGKLSLQEGDVVRVPVRNTDMLATVVALDSDYTGPCKEVLQVVSKAFKTDADMFEVNLGTAGFYGRAPDSERRAIDFVNEVEATNLAKSPSHYDSQKSSPAVVDNTKPNIAASLRDPFESSSGVPQHIIVIARAGTGKTTTIVEGLKYIRGLPTSITPSPQQAAIWEQMLLSKGAQYICFCAFNASIAAELKRRVPPGCDALTMHGMGYKSVRKIFKLKDGDEAVNEYRVHDIIARIYSTGVVNFRKEKPVVLKATKELVDLCKMNLTEPTKENLSELVSHYDVQLTDERPGRRFGKGIADVTPAGKNWQEEVFGLVPQVLDSCKDVERDQCVDYCDMIWLPIVLDLPMFRYDLLLGDEVQDWNRCQQAIAKKSGDRLILVGDPRQAIYGFAGADDQSMKRMEDELSGCDHEDPDHTGQCIKCQIVLEGNYEGRGCKVLSLTVTRRCGKAIVKEANRIVPEFEAHESNPEGEVKGALFPLQKRGVGIEEIPLEKSYIPLVQDKDMILCRINAPLVNQCLKFIKLGRKAFVQGRDIGKGLTALLDKLAPASIPDLISLLQGWMESEVAKEQARNNPSESKIQAITDKHDCLMAFATDEGVKSADDIRWKITNIFSSKMCPNCKKKDFKDKDSHCPFCKVALVLPPGVRLSSVHKAKGLEAENVFFLRPAIYPTMRPKSKWQMEQEDNLTYVAVTRAIKALTYVY